MTNPYRKPYDVDIIVVGYNKHDLTTLCLDSIRSATKGISYLVTYIDNGSDEPLGDGCKLFEMLEWYDTMQTVVLPFNHGYCRGVNVGLSMAMLSPAKYVLLLNNDTEIPYGDSSWLQRMVDAIETAPDIAAVGAVSDMVGGYQRIDAGQPRMADDAVAQVPALVGFCLLIRKSVIRQVGYLDERFEPGNFDDFDYSKRMTDLGYRLLIAGSVFIHHKAHSTTGTVTPGADLYAINKAKFIEKWGAGVWEGFGLEDVNLAALKEAVAA